MRLEGAAYAYRGAFDVYPSDVWVFHGRRYSPDVRRNPGVQRSKGSGVANAVEKIQLKRLLFLLRKIMLPAHSEWWPS